MHPQPSTPQKKELKMPLPGSPDTPEQTPSVKPSLQPAPGAGDHSPRNVDDYRSPWTGAPLKAVRNPNHKIKTKEVRKLVQPDFYPDSGPLHPELMLELYYKPRHWFLEAASLAAYLKAWAGHPLTSDPEAFTQAIGRDLAATVRYKVAVRCTFRLRDLDQTIITSVYAYPPRYKEDKSARKALKKARKAERDARRTADKARKTEDKAQAKAAKEASKREKAARKAEKRATRQQPLPLLSYQATPSGEESVRAAGKGTGAPATSAPTPTRTRRTATADTAAPTARGRRARADSSPAVTETAGTSGRNGEGASTAAPARTATRRAAPAKAPGSTTRTRQPRNTPKTATGPLETGAAAADKTKADGSGN